MAYEKLSAKKTISTNLGEYIQSLSLLIQQNRMRQNLEDEQRFNKAVLEDNLTLEQQLDYRKDQLARVDNLDKDEKLRIKGEISNLKDRIEQKKFSDKYLEELTRLNSGAQSIETTINWLKDTLSRTTDLNIKDNIKDNINQLEGKLYEQRQNALSSRTKYAAESQDLNIIDKQINSINSERVKALRAGNDDYVALLDLQVQSLNKAKSEAEISKTLMDFSVATMTGGSATQLLNEFNKQLESASQDTPITIGGTRYDSARSFWELKRSEYLNDRSENGFFNRYQSELNDKLVYKSTRNILNNDTFGDVNNWYDGLKDRPEITPYLERLEQDKQKALTSTADLRASSIINEFGIKLDAQKALSDLAYIQDTYGVDQSLNYQKIVSAAASEKQNQVSQILSTMSQIMAQSPGISNKAAMEMAIKSGAGATVTPEELATQKASDIITGLSDKATAQEFGDETPLNVNQQMANKFTADSSLRDGGLYKSPTDKTVYKFENGSLRPFAGNWDEETFKQYTGSGFQAVQELKDVNSLSKGSPIMVDDARAQGQVDQVGEKIASPELLKYYKPEDIITQGQDKFLKSGVKPVTGEKLTYDKWTEMQKQYDPKTLEDKVIRSGKDIYLKAY